MKELFLVKCVTRSNSISNLGTMRQIFNKLIQLCENHVLFLAQVFRLYKLVLDVWSIVDDGPHSGQMELRKIFKK